MAQLELKLPETKDVEWQDAQFPFDGQWLPAQDPALIGPRNFSTLTNLRYNEKSIEGVNGYSKINTTPITDYTYIDNGHHLRTNRTNNSFVLVHAVDPLTGQGRVYQNTTEIANQGDFDSTSKFDTSGNSYKADASVDLIGRFSMAPQSSAAYCNGEESFIYSGFEQRVAAVFLQKGDADAAVKEITDEMNSTLDVEYISFPDSTFDEMIIMTTRPVQGFKFYVKTANASAATMTISYWDGDSWVAVSNGSDGTVVGGKTLAQTGFHTFDHTEGLVKLKQYNELYLFAYKMAISAGTPEIYNITCDPAFNKIQNVWDGIYRQPIQFQVFSADHYEDYTLQVNQSSDLNAPIGAQIDGLLATDVIYIMFEEQMSAIRLTLLGDLVNKATSAMSLSFWDGDSWEAVTNFVDGTDVGGVSINKTGLVSWTPDATEQRQTLFGSLGYAYKIVFDNTLTGTKGTTPEVLIDLCSGIPKLEEVEAFDFPVMYKNRLMLCAASSSGQGNRMDFSAPNAPDVFNGNESSDGGLNSIYYGGEEPIRGAVQLFNRFGASVFAMLLVFKDTETYILVGDSVDDFQVYPVSTVVGCPVPLTISTTEVSLEGGENYSRNFVIWLSHSGPLMFDGAVIVPVKGVENYFDPNKSEFINWDYVYKCRAWIDPDYKEWNLLIPSGASATEVNVWLVYDLIHRKWFRKDTATTDLPICGFNTMNPNTGEQHAFGGLDTGYMMHLENGTDWDGTGITQVVKTGDFWPSNNIWDLTVLRKFKIVAKKISSASSYNLYINYFPNTEINPGQSANWVDSDVSFGGNVDFTDTTDVEWEDSISTTFELTLDVGLQRVVRKTVDLNNLAFSHAFSFEVTTDDVQAGFQPIVWGVQFRTERKDNTAG